MSAGTGPEFPFQLVWLETGEIESYEDPQNLLCNLEDFDSGRPTDRAEATVTDARGRPVLLVVRIWTDTCEYRFDDGGG